MINLEKYNQHWKTGFRYSYPIHRTIFSDLSKNIDSGLIQEIVGMRRVGKSTLMLQMINILLDRGVSPYSIVYATFDEQTFTLDEVIHEYTRITSQDLSKDSTYVFLDEIQKCRDYPNGLKTWYDLYPHIKFSISGSFGMSVRAKARESLAGRTQTYSLGPLSFGEYLSFTKNTYLLEKPLAHAQQLKNEFSVYMTAQFPQTVELKNQADRIEYAKSLLQKIIYEDIPYLYEVRHSKELLLRIVEVIARQPGGLINFIHLGQDIGIHAKTASLYMEYLAEAHIVKPLLSFSTNIVSAKKRLKKYYLATPAFCPAIADFIPEGLLYENYVISQIPAAYFYRDIYGHEVDAVLTGKDGRIVPIEIKATSSVKPEDALNLILFLKKYHLSYGYIWSMESAKRKMRIGEHTITILPFYDDLSTNLSS